MAAGVRDVAALPDPVGETLRAWTRPNGIEITKRRVPIGVVGIIYESRPNVTSDAAVLCTKTGNAAILRGGSEALRTNLAIAAALREGAASAGLPADCIQLIAHTDREAVRHLAQMDRYVDLLVPRGGTVPHRSRRRSTPGCPSSSITTASASSTWTAPPTRTWRSASSSTRKPSAPASATRWKRCSSTATSPPPSCPAPPTPSGRAASNCAATPPRARSSVNASSPRPTPIGPPSSSTCAWR